MQKKAKNIPFHYQPEEMDLAQWQIGLRKQFVIGKSFEINKINGAHPVFADYTVHNAETRNAYKVAIRDNKNSMNFCSCLDFKTNQLGTCKHIEAVLLHIEATPKLQQSFITGYTPPYTSVYLAYKDNRAVKIRIGSESATAFKKLAAFYFDDEQTLKPDAFDHFERFLTQAHALGGDFRCYDDALEYVLDVRAKNQRTAGMDHRYPQSEKLQGLLKTDFFPYQHQGVLFASKAGRCLIADEMGLGKTIQAIGAAELMKKEVNISKVLIICPTSLKYQWQAEIEKFTDSSVQVIEGLPHRRTEQYKQDQLYKIASYHTVGNDLNAVNETEFDLVILDEAQRIKNWKTKIARAVKKIKSPYCVVLTGTPLENKLEDLYSIVQFIDPFRLGPYYHFLNRYQITNETGKVTGYRHLNEVGERLKDLMLRRTKKEVLSQLPERMDKLLFVPMTQPQQDMHTEFADAVARLVNKWRRMGFLNEKDRQRLLINLNLMRMVCDSTYIVDQTTRHDTKIDELMNVLDECFENSSEKVVVFSQWERMTRLVAAELDSRGMEYEYLHGGVPSKDRKALFDNFNTKSECRVFLSTDAGSTGLNLQSASMLINLDIPWNPAVLEQRIARIHRLGQKKKVSIINFVSKDTIESRMLGVLKFKSSLAEGILDLGEDTIFTGDDKFKKFMQNIEELASAPAADDLQVNTISEEEESEAAVLQTPGETPADTQTEIGFSDDDTVPEKQAVTPATPDATQLLTQGLHFLGGLAQTLSSPEATASLVRSITDTDAQTGKTYLKIPLENQETLVNVLNLVGKMFAGKRF